MNSYGRTIGVRKGRKVDHFRFLIPLKVGPSSLRSAWQESLCQRADKLMRAIRWCISHRQRGGKNIAGLKADLFKHDIMPSTVERAQSIARCGEVRLCGRSVLIDCYYAKAEEDAYFDVRSWQHGANLDDAIHAVKLIATDLGLDGIYTSHFCTVPFVSPTEKRTLIGHFGGAVLVTASRHEFLTSHRLIEKLVADEQARRVDLKAITDTIAASKMSPNQARKHFGYDASHIPKG